MTTNSSSKEALTILITPTPEKKSRKTNNPPASPLNVLIVPPPSLEEEQEEDLPPFAIRPSVEREPTYELPRPSGGIYRGGTGRKGKNKRPKNSPFPVNFYHRRPEELRTERFDIWNEILMNKEEYPAIGFWFHEWLAEPYIKHCIKPGTGSESIFTYTTRPVIKQSEPINAKKRGKIVPLTFPTPDYGPVSEHTITSGKTIVTFLGDKVGWETESKKYVDDPSAPSIPGVKPKKMVKRYTSKKFSALVRLENVPGKPEVWTPVMTQAAWALLIAKVRVVEDDGEEE